MTATLGLGQDPVQEIENRMREEEWLITDWSPIHLANLLKAWYFKDGVKDINAQRVWHDTCHYLYMPRLLNEGVFETTIASGLETEDFFGYANGKDGGKYLGFAFGRSTLPVLDDAALLIEQETAKHYKDSIVSPTPSSEDQSEEGSIPISPVSPDSEGRLPSQTGSHLPKRRFYGVATLDPIKAKMDFASIVDEVVQNFTLKSDVTVKISVDIQADSKTGFDENLQRIVRENCNVLKFNTAEFDEE